ncbi:hypothetical protein IJH46_01255 [Candidatus Saccharibacteria bacterium]|nr:hypothetical protein [Candidatus Saccharibacteria bacterium]
MNESKIPPNANITMIVKGCRKNILSKNTIILFVGFVMAFLLCSILSIYYPEQINIVNNDSVASLAIGGLGVLLAIMSTWSYSDDELTRIYEKGELPRGNSMVPDDCNMEIREHFVYYSLISEHIVAIINWSMVSFGYILKQVITAGDGIVWAIATQLCNVAYLSLTALMFLIIIEIFLKGIKRKTNSVKFKTTTDKTTPPKKST